MTQQGMKLVQTAERRRCLRFGLDRCTSMTAAAGGRSYDCQVIDVSLSGLKLRFAGAPPAAERIVLRHPTAGKLAAVQVWRAGNDLGLAFETPERALEHLLQCISLILNPEDPKIAQTA